MNDSNDTGKLVQPYLFFEGRCDEALEFYRQKIGAEDITIMRFKEGPDQSMCPPSNGEKVMHASFRIGESTIMASDGKCEGAPAFQGFALSITLPAAEEAERAFSALSEGGEVQMPMTQTFFADRFGMVIDQFGVCWMLLVRPGSSEAQA